MRVLFAGSPAAALPSLELVAGKVGELAVMSQPDRPVGRKKTLTPTPVSQWAIDRGVPLYRPETAQELAEQVRQWAPDLGITAAFGRILTPDVLAIPSEGWWNVHFSVLPRWRGAAPVQQALLAGDTTAGVTIFQLDKGLDTGPILGSSSHPIREGVTYGDLLAELAEEGAALLNQVLARHVAGSLTPVEQVGEPTHAPKPTRETGWIRAGDSLEMATRRFQATTPEPGCYFTVNGGDTVVRVVEAHSEPAPSVRGSGVVEAEPSGTVSIVLDGGRLVLERVVPAGKKAMSGPEWWRGVHGQVTIDG